MTDLAGALWFLPPPARRPVAQLLAARGFRRHPDLAVKQPVRTGEAWMGNHAPQALEPIKGAPQPDPGMAVDDITAIARSLMALRVMQRTMRTAASVTPIAAGLFELGVRVHPELAEQPTPAVSDRVPAGTGTAAAQGMQMLNGISTGQVREALRKIAATNPALAQLVDRIDSAHGAERDALGQQFLEGYRRDIDQLQATPIQAEDLE